ncbi:hypothetical protein [uncultured Jatrophihabitans sp.]|uniref:hypothetical protein n=1 Tax=uncultured Jatrophihabitans sp. TaxID=1610747 RepID=UPI0035CC071F
MDAIPDRRWANIVGRMTPGGVEMMSFARLADLAAEWEDIVPPQSAELDGPPRLLRMARSLFAHSWFDYEFMTVACLLGFQAMEASFRALYPDPDGRPLRKLVNQAEQDAILPVNIAELARSGVELRNLYSHPRTQSVLTVGMAAPMLENTHRLVALVLSAVR